MNPGTRPVAWITGAAGLIGSHLVQLAPPSLPWTPRPLARTDLDLTNFSALDRLFHAEQPALVIHCAALSRSPDCQQNPALAQLLNTTVTAHLSALCSSIPLLFLSTDLVFDGTKGNYTELDNPNPLSVYAETKLAAEQAVLRNPRHTVIRTSLNFGFSPSGNRSFNEELAHAWRQGTPLRLFTDEFRCPIPASATAAALWELASHHSTGLYHVAGSQRLSRFEIGQLVATRHPDLHPTVIPASLREYSGAPRPPDTSLNSSKAQAILSFPLPGLRSYLTSEP
jgi:dTDP-4-dehydrorhamnose reductase